ncbi:MAG: hypothetical protein UX91_C0007G0010 [Candidatus Amesbacteria bacterium GW2011_GWB1_47_19]|nr:MAG: hypothetical protein UW51_C0006G0170 [Candidatus Amesbacteria bacterium GW2011_GWA1_44_24]KKU31794.1 MAG: hypothetical protein UX46_C0002G0010 [Candidatus Amesbacteria bacterium GW2011_GWC1_46_24]KKU66730.1 MAG: hypothetical protein UX91_C0007G0010 [Candidatus Amesbacteria bacterium GW2011_GWB1_47_19]OGD05715.1 MAG: hypothetical protein A2379_00620 [Candidatus Amesbacteria bacterium RIFOXYB1_FULL_47_13]HBC73095.1 hypothetical protein [Candidatus Amesbacteria bacterium]
MRPSIQSGIYGPGSSSLTILPPHPPLDIRNDLIFIPVFLTVVLSLSLVTIFRVKIFGLTLAEYLRPVWYFVLVAIAVVFWQYLVGVKTEGTSLQLRISQWVWEAMVLASAYKLSKNPKFSYNNMLILGILFSFIIHGLKVSIRYFFYAKTLWYVLDRFLYGSLLVMLIAVGLGSVFILLRDKKLK